MRVRHYITSAALISALMAGVAYAPDAMAQKGSMLDPTTPWAIKKVNDSSGEKDPYCAVARRFVPKTVMTLARNGRDESSFALDFQSSRLNPKNIYYVLLNPGVGQKRAYEVRPVSERAFVIRLGEDERFFEALQKTGYLRVEVGNQGYNFNLADIEAGWAKLNSCVDEIRVIPHRNGFVPRASQKSSPFSSGYRFDKQSKASSGDALKAQLSKLQQENRRLNLAEASERDSFSVADGLLERVNWLEEENDILGRQLAEARAIGTTGNYGTDYDKIAQLEEENIELRSELRKIEAAGYEQQVIELKQELAQAKDQNLEILKTAHLDYKRLEQQKDMELAALEALQEDNMRLHSLSLAEMQARIDNLNDKIHEKDAKLLALTQEGILHDNLLAENEQLRKEIEALHAGDYLVSQLKEKVASLEVENNALSDELSMLQQVNLVMLDGGAAPESSASQASKDIAAMEAVETRRESVSTDLSALDIAPVPKPQLVTAELVKPSVKPALPKRFVQTDKGEESLAHLLAGIETAAGDEKPISIIKDKAFVSSFNLPEFLQQNHVVNSNQIDVIDKGGALNQKDYKWKIGGVFGTAVQVYAPKKESFESFVKQYLEKRQKHCNGDFAIIPDQSFEESGDRVDTYELACVGSASDLAASLIFFRKDNTINVVAHDVPIQSMERGMEMRDRLLESVKKSG